MAITKKAQAIQAAKAEAEAYKAAADARAQQDAVDLTTTCLLVDLDVHQWVAAKYDQKVAQEVATQHGSDVRMGHYRKALVSRDAIATMRRISADIYIEHRRRTLPWYDGGIRILSSLGYFDYQTAMAKLQDEWNEALETFLANYPSHREAARAFLNGLFDEADYPSERKIRSKFRLAWTFSPMPNTDDFRRVLSQEAAEALIQRTEASYGLAIREANRDTFRRVKTVVGKMVERLPAYKVEGGKTGRLYDSMLENVRELVEILPSLNITNDATLTEVTNAMRDELLKYDVETLKTDDTARAQTAKAAQSILDKMSAFVA